MKKNIVILDLFTRFCYLQPSPKVSFTPPTEGRSSEHHFGHRVNDEFLRITTKPLQLTFLAQLGHFSEKLLQIFQSKGGVKGHKMKNILAVKDACDNINIRRESVLKSLVVYLNEDPDSLFKEYPPSAAEDAENGIATVMGIYTFRRNEFDLSYPDNLKYTFEFVQKILMSLDGHKVNTKIQQLKIKLFM